MKKLKILLIVFVVIILAAGGYVYYELKLKDYDVADEQVEAIVEEGFEVQLPDGTTVVFDQNGNIIETKNNTQSDANEGYENSAGGENSQAESSQNDSTQNSNAQSGSSANTGAKNNNQSTPERVTVAAIKSKYITSFSSLEEQAQNRINALVNQAKGEYTSKKNNGEKISYGYFYRKYVGAASTLENSTTAAVNALVKIVEADLETNGYEKSHAQSFIKEYEATKESLRSKLLKKAKELI